MLRTICPLFACLAIAAGAASAQDVRGIELCTRETQVERRTSCLQSNIEYLQSVITKNATAAQQKLNAAAGEVAALKSEIAALHAALGGLQTRLDALEAAAKRRAPEQPAKTPAEKRPETPAGKP